MSDDNDGDSVFAESDEPILCPICDCIALEYRVCVDCDEKVGMACVVDTPDGAVCNACIETRAANALKETA